MNARTLEGLQDHEETLQHLVRKAGYRGPLTEEMRDTIQMTRYQSAHADLTFDAYRVRTRLALPVALPN